MVSADLIRTMYDYNRWAHRLVWQSVMSLTDAQFIQPIDYSWGSIKGQIVHTMSAEWMWFTRLNGTSPESMFNPDDFPTREAIRARWDEIERDVVHAYVNTLDDTKLTSMFTYTTTSGMSHTQSVGEILLHIVNHGTDHRAQTLAMLHQIGAATVEQDFVFYLRERVNP